MNRQQRRKEARLSGLGASAKSADYGRTKAGKARQFLLAGTRLHRDNKFRDAITQYGAALELVPQDKNAWHLTAIAQMELGNLPDAAAAMRKCLDSDPEFFEAWYNLGIICRDWEKFQESANAFLQAHLLRPDAQNPWMQYCHTLLTLGKIDEAKSEYRKMIERWPRRLEGFSGLIHADASAVSDDELSFIEEAVGQPNDRVNDPAGLCFALGEAWEAKKDYDKAFGYFARANQTVLKINEEEADKPSTTIVAPQAKRIKRNLATAIERHINECRFVSEIFSTELLDQYAGMGSPSQRPVFVVGMPRSGSTLLDQILSSHSSIGSVGESNLFNASCIGKHWPFSIRTTNNRLYIPPPPPKDMPAYLQRLAQSYLDAIHEFAPTADRIVNKMLTHYLHIGWILMVFPNATIIHSMRDPIDNCLGCYRKMFATGHEYTNDLKALGEHYVRYRQVMDYWRKVLPGKFIDIAHEDLVENQEAATRRLIEQLGLPWDDRCLHFYENKRSVRTASVAQVRQPIFKDAVQRWRKYEKHLTPLLDALAPVLESGPK